MSKIAKKVLGDGEELYSFLLAVARGEVTDSKWLKDPRAGDVEVQVPVAIKTRVDVAKWLLEALHGRAAQSHSIAVADVKLPDVSQLPTSVLTRLVNASDEQIAALLTDKSTTDVQTLHAKSSDTANISEPKES